MVGGQSNSVAWTYDTVGSTATNIGAKITNPFGTGSIGNSVVNGVSNRYSGTLAYAAGAVYLATSGTSASQQFGFVWDGTSTHPTVLYGTSTAYTASSANATAQGVNAAGRVVVAGLTTPVARPPRWHSTT